MPSVKLLTEYCLNLLVIQWVMCKFVVRFEGFFLCCLVLMSCYGSNIINVCLRIKVSIANNYWSYMQILILITNSQILEWRPFVHDWIYSRCIILACDRTANEPNVDELITWWHNYERVRSFLKLVFRCVISTDDFIAHEGSTSKHCSCLDGEYSSQ